ncbi:MAG: aspartate dehydrogenase [Minwuia sp.]|nr:aspartate dehydrogenase [Minwuia sp.]
MQNVPSSPLKVAVAGLGAVGLPLARWLDQGQRRLALHAVSAQDQARATARMSDFRVLPPIRDLDTLCDGADVVVEGLPPALFRPLAECVLGQGLIFVPLTVTQLILHMDLIDLAEANGARIIVPTGAILGLDAVRAAAKGNVQSVTMMTRKPPAGLIDTPHVVELGLDLTNLTEPMKLYEGPVRDAAQKFPANVNVSVALALAGIGLDRTRYEIWADPGVSRNTHVIEVEADSTRFRMEIAGVPSPGKPATGRLTPLSAMAALEGLVSTLKIGS